MGLLASLLLYLVVFALYVLLVHRVALKAERKGKSYGIFSVFGFFLGLIPAAVVVELLPNNHPGPGDAVELLQRTGLDDGTELPKGHRAAVNDIDLTHSPPLVQIEGPSRPVWIARSNVKRL